MLFELGFGFRDRFAAYAGLIDEVRNGGEGTHAEFVLCSGATKYTMVEERTVSPSMEHPDPIR